MSIEERLCELLEELISEIENVFDIFDPRLKHPINDRCRQNIDRCRQNRIYYIERIVEAFHNEGYRKLMEGNS